MRYNVWVRHVVNVHHLPTGGITITKAGVAELREWSQPRVPLFQWRLFWNPELGACLRLGDERVDLGPATAALVSPGAAVSGSLLPDAKRPVRHVFVHFKLEVNAHPVHAMLLPVKVTPAMRDRLAEVQDPGLFSSAAGLVGLFRAASLVATVLAELDQRPWQVIGGDERIRRIVTLIHECFDQPLTIERLADAAALTPTSFIRLFTRQVGVSPYQYLRGYRLQRAQEMLLERDVTIEEVARCCGFSDRTTFSRAYRMYFRQPPAEFRRNVAKSSGVAPLT